MKIDGRRPPPDISLRFADIVRQMVSFPRVKHQQKRAFFKQWAPLIYDAYAPRYFNPSVARRPSTRRRHPPGYDYPLAGSLSWGIIPLQRYWGLSCNHELDFGGEFNPYTTQKSAPH